MKKTELRGKYKILRANLSPKKIEDSSLLIANHVLKLPIWDRSFFHIFLTIESLNEVLTEPIMSILSGKDKHIVVSKSDFKTQTMSHVLLQDNTILKPISWNIPEPENGVSISDKQIEVVFIPLVAFDENRVIGKNNELIWHLPADLKRFKALTTGHVIIMGRKTYDSIGKPLPNRTTIVISRNPALQIEGVICTSSMEEAILKALETTPPELAADIYRRGLYITGGGSLLRGLDKRLSQKIKLPVHVADDPLKSVVRGTGIALKNYQRFPFIMR